MRQLLSVLLAVTGSAMMAPSVSIVAAEGPPSLDGEVQQLRNDLIELRKLIEQISNRLDGMEQRLEKLEISNKRVIQVVPLPGLYRSHPWNGTDAGMMLDALEHQQRFGPALHGQPLRFEPQAPIRPAPLPLRKAPRE